MSSPKVTTAPTGTSPAAAASRASSSARRIGGGSGKLIGRPPSRAAPACQLLPIIGRGRLVAGRLNHQGRHPHVGLLRPDFDRAGLDVEGGRLAALAND